MPLILHGSARLPNYQIVLIVAAELKLELETVEVDMRKGEHKQPAYLEHQPFGQIPWFEDTEAGIEIFESRAICRYLVVKCGADHLMPLPNSENYLARLAKFETAASIEYSSWLPSLSAFVRKGVFNKAFGYGDPDPVVMQQLSDELGKKLDGYERILSKQLYFAEPDFSLVDLLHYSPGKYLFRIGYGNLIESRPNVARWWKSVVERDSGVKVWEELKLDEILDSMLGVKRD